MTTEVLFLMGVKKEMDDGIKLDENELRYEDTDIDERIIKAVKEMGFEVMTPIQAMAIPEMINGRDIIGQAQTGTGKTASFGIPIIQSIEPEFKALQALVLSPTRELAIQAAEEIRKFAKYIPDIRVLPVYGGQDISKQIRSLRGDVQIVVGTPGRVMDHMRRHTIDLSEVKIVVLDEADEMLDMGFREDMETILDETPKDRQTALFSATMPKPILEITSRFQKEDAVFVKIPSKELTIPLVRQYYYEVSRKNKEEAVSRLLDYYNPKRSLIFCNTKRMADELAQNLTGRGYFAEALHGDLSQMQRDRVMQGFKNGQTEILIATDVAARGLDIDDVEAVFNYDVPQDIEYYVHRIGRTGRAGKKGRSFTLVVGREVLKIRDIERYCKTTIEARTIPSSADVKNSKSEKILERMIGIVSDEDLSETIMMVERKLNDEDFTALELAAAFLKDSMGDNKYGVSDEEMYVKPWEWKKQKNKDDGGRRKNKEGKKYKKEFKKGYKDFGGYKKIKSKDLNNDGSVKKKKKDGSKHSSKHHRYAH